MEIDFNNTGILLEQHGKTFLKRQSSFLFRWARTEIEALDIIKRGFIYSDEKVSELTFEETEELKKIALWMTDTAGQGLALIGSSGRGKTLFMHGVLPHLLISKGKVPFPIKAVELDNNNYGKILLIDEIGREDLVFDKNRGKIDRFAEYVDYCADKNRPLFFTSNLSKDKFSERYGEHIFNRVTSICKVIIHNGKSMW